MPLGAGWQTVYRAAAKPSQAGGGPASGGADLDAGWLLLGLFACMVVVCLVAWWRERRAKRLTGKKQT